VSEGEFDPVSF